MDVGAAVGADLESATGVEPGEGAFDDPAVAAQAGAVPALAARDHWLDASLPDKPPVLVVVVAAVGEQTVGPSARPADATTHGRHPVDQRDELRDVVAVAAGERPGQRDATAVYEEVVLAARAAAVDGARTCFLAPFFACR